LPIAIIHQSYGRFGGAERVALAHYEQLRRMNVDATLFWSGVIYPGWQARLNGYEVRIIPSAVPSPRRLAMMMRFLRELSRYDKIIIHHHVDPLLALYIAKNLGDRTIWYSGSMFELAWEKWITGEDYRSISRTVKQTSEEYYGRTLSSLAMSNPVFDQTVRLARAVDIHAVKRYSKIVANSKFLSRFLYRIYKLGDPPPVVYPGPDPMLEQLSSKDFAGEGDYMFEVCPLIPLKNVDGIIQAASKVPSARLVVVGDGQDRVSLEESAQRMHVPLFLKGNSHNEEELAMLYSQCMFHVHLSLYEPFGLTPVEAGLFRKPSIVTNHGGPPEIIIEGETGFIVGPRDYGTIAKRMRELLSNPQLRREMGQKARKRVLENFTLERSAKQLLAEVEF
jgi:glycosyltransferase involved in cell wall biosynthesis